MKRFPFHLILAASALGLSVVSLWVVVRGATDEPYVVFRGSDAIVQVGVAMVLMLLWLQLAIAMVACVARQRVSAWWLPLLLWVFICEFKLLQSSSGYVYDIARYVAEAH